MMRNMMKNNASLNPGKAVNDMSNQKKMFRSFLPTILINAVLPLLIYLGMSNVLHQSEFLSLIATGIPSALISIVGIIRNRRIDFLAGVVLSGIVVGLLITLVSNDPKLLLIRDSFFTAAFGL